MSSEPEFDDQPLPVNLHFPDERVLTVDIDAVMDSGRRMRRNRKALVSAVAAAAIGVLGASAAYLAPGTSSSRAPVVGAAPSTGSSHSPSALDFLAGGGHVTVLGSRANPMAGFTLSVVAWRAGGQICSGTADLAAGGGSDSSITCADRPAALSVSTPAVVAPHLVAGVTDATGSQVAIGFTNGGVAKVSLKIHGHRYDADVVALPGTPSTGAYMVWISPEDVVTSARDFTQIVGYDGRGVAVTG